MTLFKHSSGEGWPDFEKDLIKDGHMKDGSFPTDVLVQLAYGYAQKKGLPQGKLKKEEFNNLFLYQLNLGETIKATEFRAMGQAGKFFLDDLVKREATMATEVPATSVAVTPVAPVATAAVYGGTFPASADVKQAMAIANMEGQVKKLQEEVAKSGSNQKEVKELARQLKEFGVQLKLLNDGQDGFATDGDIDAANKALTDFKTKVGDLEKLRTDVAGLQTDVNILKGNPILAWGSWLLLAIGVLFLLCFATIYLMRRASKADVKVVKEMVTQVEDKVNSAKAAALSAKQEVQAVAAEVTLMKKVSGYQRVLFPDGFDGDLKRLIESNGKRRFELTVGAEKRLIEIEACATSNLLAVRGLDEVTKGVNPDNLQDVIYRAARLAVDGTHRIRGVEAATPPKAA